MLVSVPEPYDFELSLAKYRLFGSGGATVWHGSGPGLSFERFDDFRDVSAGLSDAGRRGN